jgi:hypothetical protein
MELNANQVTEMIPSSFGMPGCGHAFVTLAPTSRTTVAGAFADAGKATTTEVVRDRKAVTTGDLGLAIAYVPGTSAWRPPSS